MLRALTIRFGLMAVGLAPLVFLVNTFNVAPGLALVALLAYMAAGVLIIGNYCVAHEDEIPMRAERGARRR
jgi:hypothetical protein